MTRLSVLITLLATLVEASQLPRCKDLSLEVPATATVPKFPENFNLTTFNLTTARNLPQHTVSGTFEVGGSFCEPCTTHGSRSNTLQILVHGITYDRTYWNGLSHSVDSANALEYSWVDFFSAQGYPVLTIDRLCNGQSSHPNGSDFCQIKYQGAVIKSIIDQARSGRFGGKRFSRIILVGHSEGSMITNSLIHDYPDAVDGVVLTGYSSSLLQNLPAAISSGAFSGNIAKQIDPAKYKSLGPEYHLITDFNLFISQFFYGSFDKGLVEYNFNNSGTFNTFEIASAQFGQQVSQKFNGTVIALNGEEDAIFCAKANCGQGPGSTTARVSSFYLNARAFGYHNANDTGHCLSLHYSARQSYEAVSRLLSQQGY